MREIRKKVVLFGNIGVGKSSISRRYVSNEYSDTYMSSIGMSIEKKVIEHDDVRVILMIWDLAGEVFETNQFEAYLKGAHGIVGIFDCTRPSTYALLTNSLKSRTDCHKVIVANKVDLLTPADKEKTDKGLEIDHFTSAKTGEGLDAAFMSLVDKMIPNNSRHAL